MIYLLFVFIALVSVCAILYICGRKGVVDIGSKLKIYKPCEEDVVPYKGKSLILITMICFAVALPVQISLYKNTVTINFVKLYGLLLIVLSAGIIDAKRRIIPNVLVITGLVFRLLIYIYEFIYVDSVKDVLVNDLIGFAIGFVLLALVSLISKGSLGFGDAKLFGVIGITAGSFCTYSTLLVSLVISTIVSVVNIARKKMGRKDSFPFGPCIAAGYVIVVLLTSY